MIRQVQSGEAPTFRNPSRVFSVSLESLKSNLWTNLRFDLEQGSGGLSQEPQLDVEYPKNRGTQIVGYRITEKDKQESLEYEVLTSKSFLRDNDLIYVVRKSMPLGGRVYVPLDRQVRVNELKKELQVKQSEKQDHDMKQLLQKIDLQAQQNLKNIDNVQNSEVDNLDALNTEMDLLISRHQKNSAHISESPRTVHILTGATADCPPRHLPTECEYEDASVPKVYKCFKCMTTGEHNQTACFLQKRKDPERPQVLWGASKFKKLEF